MLKKPTANLAITIASFLLIALSTSPFSHAQIRVTTPSFPSCENPEGQTVASYQTGIHGIPGDSNTYTGSDTVYNLTTETLTQCFCSENADGIQTNWWKVSSLTIEEVEYLQALGWVYIPNGAEWGLQKAPYLAQNIASGCDGNGEDKKVKIVRNRMNNNKNDDNDGGIGSVLGISTIALGDVLGLATTGNWNTIALLGTTGFITLGAGLYLIKKSNAKKTTA